MGFAFPTTRHAAFLVATVFKCYLLFCKDHDLNEQENRGMLVRVPLRAFEACWRNDGARARSRAGGSAEAE